MIDPKDIPGTLRIAEAALKGGDLQSALDRLDELDEILPIPEAAHRLASRIAAAQDDPIEAMRRLDLAVETAGVTTASDLANRAQFCHIAGHLEEALATLDRLPSRTDPRSAAASLFLRTRCLSRLGRIQEARERIRDLIKLEGRSLRAQWLIAEVNATDGDQAGARERYEAILSDRRIPPQIRITAAFGLARACDRLADHEAAFEAAEIGNQMIGSRFDADAHRAETDSIIRWATPDRMADLPRASVTDERPVFVVGLPRTGTSLLEQIVASHSRAAGVGERRDPILGAQRLAHRSATPFPACLESSTVADFDAIAERHSRMLDRSGFAADRIVNKALGLERILPLLAAAFPGGRVILISRDPRDQISSCFLHPLRGQGLEWACRLEDLVIARQEHDRLVEHLAPILPMPVHRITYEDLIADQSGTTDGILRFLQLDPEEACLKFHEQERTVMTPSFDQVDKPITDSAIGRWKSIESRIGPVLRAFPDA